MKLIEHAPASLLAILDEVEKNYGHECDFEIQHHNDGYVIDAKRRVAVMGAENFWHETWIKELISDPQYVEANYRSFLDRLRYDGVKR